MKPLAALFLTAMLLGCAGGGPAAPQSVELTFAEEVGEPSRDVRALAERSVPGYLYVTISAPGSGVANSPTAVINAASATLVDQRGYAVTVAHIAKSTEFAAEVMTADGERHAAEILHVAADRELALLKFEPSADARLEPLPIAPPDSLARGDFVLAIGTPDNKPGVATSGEIVHLRKDKRIEYGVFGFNDALVMEMEIVPGYSGGPLIDVDGRLVGIVASFALGDTTRVPYVSPRLAYAVPAAQIRAYLDEVLPE